MISAEELTKLVKNENELRERGVQKALESMEDSFKQAADLGHSGYQATIGNFIAEPVKDTLVGLGYDVILEQNEDPNTFTIVVKWEEPKPIKKKTKKKKAKKEV